MYLVSPKRGSTFRAAGHLGVSAGQCASCNNKAFLPIMDSHRVGYDFRGPGRILKFGPACNSESLLYLKCSVINGWLGSLGPITCRPLRPHPPVSKLIIPLLSTQALIQRCRVLNV